MRPKRLLVYGALVIGGAAPFAFACGDSSFETVNNDASISEAATPDATTVGDAALFCSSQGLAALCADFDEPDLRTGFEFGAQTAAFAALVGTGGGIIGAADAGLSPPTALETALPIDAGPATDATVQSASADSVLSALTGATHFRLEADVRFNEIGDLSGGSSVVLAGLQLAGIDGYTVFVLNLHVGHIYVDAFSSLKLGSTIDLGGVPSAGSNWVHLVIDLTSGIDGKLSGSLGTYDAQPAGSLLDRSEVTPTLSIGPSTMGGTGTIDMSFDNVLFLADSPDAGSEVDASFGRPDAG
jgi:hypothetical protein